MRNSGKIFLLILIFFLLSSCGGASVSISPQDTLFDFEMGKTTDSVSVETEEPSVYRSAAETVLNDPAYRDFLSRYGDDADAASVLAAFLEYLDVLSAEKADETSETEGTEENPVIPDRGTPTGETVYWTRGGEVWHTRADCPSLAKSTEILSGTVEEAKQAGKARVCKRCDSAE